MALLDPHGTDAELTLDLVSQVIDYAIIALDRDGVVRSWNAGAERLKGYHHDEIVGRHFSVFYGEDDRRVGLPDRLLQQAAREGRVAHTGWRVRRDGTRFWGDVVITALRDTVGELTGYAKVTRDRTEEHLLEQSLRASESRLRLLVSQVVDYAIIALDADGVIRTWNAGAERLKGYTAPEAIGRHFSVFYTEDDRASGLPQELLARARAEGRVEHTGWRVRRDGTLFWGVVVITALHDDSGVLTGYAKVTRDRTDRHRLEEMQASLVAMTSHDIRQPLMAIGLHASAIADLQPAMRAEYAERILVSAEQLESMINTVFDHARLRAVPMRPEPIALDTALHEVTAAYRHLLAERDVDIDAAGVVAHVDPVALQRVLANLLTNAAKYSPAGSPIALTADVDGDRTVLRVADRGRGVAPEDIPVIFDEFVRGQYAADDGGTGLGLASVRYLVERHGGTVRMESTPGVGTTVVVTLPRAQP